MGTGSTNTITAASPVLSDELGDCRHGHTGSCSPDGVYLYVRCMDCWRLLATSEEGARRLDDCPGYEPPKRGYGRACMHCGFDWWDHQQAAERIG